MPLTSAIRATTDALTHDASYAKVTLAATPDETFWEFYVYVPTSSIAGWTANGTGPAILALKAISFGLMAQAVAVYLDGTTVGEGFTWVLEFGSTYDSMVVVVPDTWVKIQLRTKESTAEAELYINDVSVLVGDLVNGPPDIRCVELGNNLGFRDSDLYITGFKVGTTLGASDVFDGDVS